MYGDLGAKSTEIQYWSVLACEKLPNTWIHNCIQLLIKFILNRLIQIMHAIKGVWVGNPCTFAVSKDSRKKKSRVKRSKEQRKDMVESFIKKYQEMNNGSFPSLNLAHKEVGGSFYIVREIVREIIQENRVLAPPKVLEGMDKNSGFLELHPLGSLSIEPKTDESVSVNIVSGSQIPEEDLKFDPILTNAVPIHNQDDIRETTLKSSQNFSGPSNNLRHSYDGHINSNNQIVDGEQAKGFSDRTCTESVAMLIPDRETDGAKEIEASQSVKSHLNSNVVVETFPIRRILCTSHDIDEVLGASCDSIETVDDKSSQQEKMLSIQCPSASAFVSGNLLGVENSGGQGDGKVLLEIQDPSLETSSVSTVVGEPVSQAGAAHDIELSENFLPDGSKETADSSGGLISKNSTPFESKLSDEAKTSLLKERGPVLDRLKLETQEEASKKSNVPPGNNPILALIKTAISAFVKFWTE